MNSLISNRRISCIRAQGYFNQSDQEVSDLSIGNRFAYQLCTVILILGVATVSIPLLSVMTAIAFFGVILPNHPFDYIYNFGLRQVLKKPKLPKRSKQLKFACGIATIWLLATIYFFHSGQIMAGYILGGMLAAVASTVAATDFCIPSTIYNLIFRTNR